MRFLLLALLALAAWRLLRRRPAREFDRLARDWTRVGGPSAAGLRPIHVPAENIWNIVKNLPWEEPEDGYMVVVQGT